MGNSERAVGGPTGEAKWGQDFLLRLRRPQAPAAAPRGPQLPLAPISTLTPIASLHIKTRSLETA